MFIIIENAQTNKADTGIMLGLTESLKIVEQAKSLDEAKQRIKNLLFKIEHK